jgi:hypothetical protein
MGGPPESRQVVRSLRELPRDIQPVRDLWPGIAQQLPPRRRSWALPASLAAGLVVFTLGAVIGPRLDGTRLAVAVPGPGSEARAPLLADAAYLRQREELLRALPGRLQRLPPEARQRVLDSLRDIQAAMQAIEADLGREPGNVLLHQLLISTSQDEMRVLTAVAEADGANQEI